MRKRKLLSVWTPTGLRTAALDLVERGVIFVEATDMLKELQLRSYLRNLKIRCSYHKSDNWLRVELTVK